MENNQNSLKTSASFVQYDIAILAFITSSIAFCSFSTLNSSRSFYPSFNENLSFEF